MQLLPPTSYWPMTDYWNLQLERLKVTLQVAFSKVFCSGMGWEVAAQAAGSGSSSFTFALCTGLGDGLGTFAGHFVLLGCKLLLARWRSATIMASGHSSADLAAGVWLAAGGFCSGVVWQPSVSFFHAHLYSADFTAISMFVGISCGLSFFTALQAARTVPLCLCAPSTTPWCT